MLGTPCAPASTATRPRRIESARNRQYVARSKEVSQVAYIADCSASSLQPWVTKLHRISSPEE